MVKSSAATVQQYLNELPEDQRVVISTVRDLILRNLPQGYQESMNWGLISYEVPLERYPDTYNGQPLGYAALGRQKNYYSLYLMSVYMNPEIEARLREGFAQAGKKLDMGKSCLRFRKLEDLPLELIGDLIASIPVEAYLQRYEAGRK